MDRQCKKLPADGFEWRKVLVRFNEKFIQNYNDDCVKGYMFQANVKYAKELNKLQIELPFLSKRMKINKCEKLVSNLQDKKNYVIHIRAFKHALDHGLIIEKVQDNRLQWGSMAKAVHRNKHGALNKSQKWFWEGMLQADEQCSVREDYGECKEAKRHQTCGNWWKKKSSSCRA